MDDQPVLLLTHSGDYYTIDRVLAALHERGASTFRFDTDHYPQRAGLVVRVGPDGPSLTLHTPEARLDLDSVRAVWARRMWPGKLLADVDPRFAAHCLRESRTAFFDGLALLDGVRWVNPIDAGIAAESKLRQLRAAVRAGLDIPTTVVTNHPATAREFFCETGGDMVTKLLGPLSQTMEGTGDFVYTSPVGADDMERIDELRHAPQIFQPRLDKARELRSVFVGEQVYTGAIDASSVDRGRVDWRQLSPADGVAWSHDELPADVASRTRTMMDELGLVAGAVDFIVEPDGRHVFLEINQAGEWGWLERDLGLPISDALADALLAEA